MIHPRRLALVQLAIAAVVLLGLAACCDPARGQAIAGPDRVEPYTLARLGIDWPEGIEPDPASVGWIVRPLRHADLYADGDKLVVTGPPGEYEVIAGVVIAGRVVFLGHSFEVAGDTPDPTPTPTPTPGPTPDPMGPVERVLILYESSDLTGREPWTSAPVRDAIDAIVAEDRYPDGQVVEAARYVDDDVSFDRELEVWRSARRDAAAILKAEPAATLPRVFVFHGGSGLRHFAAPATGEELVRAIRGGEGH